MIAGATYIYEKDLFSNGLEAITVSTNGKKLPIYRVNTDKPMVALSFDAAWGNEDTQKILDILKKYKINVTFFMTGGWVESYPDDVKAIKASGHTCCTASASFASPYCGRITPPLTMRKFIYDAMATSPSSRGIVPSTLPLRFPHH